MPSAQLEVFFDGACPLCSREARWLRRLDRHSRIRLTDIAAPHFNASLLGLTQDDLLARIHARLPDGRLIEGVEVFRRAYTAIGLGPLVALSRLPGVSSLLDLLYTGFARNRLRFTGRFTRRDAATCSDSRCEAPKRA
jgi:predicted DCC family thiol-disulfide oxidoreductase YuxK